MKTPIEMLQSIIDMQKENYWDGMETHMKLSDLVEEAEEVVKNHGVSHHDIDIPTYSKWFDSAKYKRGEGGVVMTKGTDSSIELYLDTYYR